MVCRNIILPLWFMACSYSSSMTKTHCTPITASQQVSLEDAKNLKTKFCNTQNLVCADFTVDHRFIDDYYVFYWMAPTLESHAKKEGIWVDSHTGEVTHGRPAQKRCEA
jgi:hypothetical protein